MTFARNTAYTIGRGFVVAIALAVCLPGCSDARRALGYDKAPPDEFAVVPRAPLSMPPNYSLRPPNPGEPRPQATVANGQTAKDIVLGRAAAQGRTLDTAGRSSGEVSLLKKAGADAVPADIRQQVNRESNALVEDDKSLTDKLVFWRAPPLPGEPVDATKETQRLRENQALGKAATEGDTAMIKRKKKGWLEGIF